MLSPKKINIPDLDLANTGAVSSFQKGKWKAVTGGFEYVEELSKFNIWSLQVVEEDGTVGATVTIEQSNFSPFGEMVNREGAIRQGKSFDEFSALNDVDGSPFLLVTPGYIQSDDIFRAKYIKIKVATAASSGKLLFEFDQK